MKRLFKNLIKLMMQLTFFALLLGLLFQFITVRIDRARFPAKGALFEVNGQTLHLDCRGEASADKPTVVLESGMGSESTNWYKVMDRVEGVGQICTYDRPGLGWSKPSKGFLQAEDWVTNLHDLLVTAEIEPPYLLVGHSIGGIITRDFAQQYPDKVAGMVLVESSTENQYEYWSDDHHNEGLFRSAGHILSPAGTVLGYLGLPRLYRMARQVQRQLEHTPEMMASLARRNEAHNIHTLTGEMKVTIGITDQGVPPKSLGDLPLRVIAKTYWVPEGSSDEWVKFEDDWRSMQTALANLSTNGTHVEAEQSAHNVPGDDPDIIAEAILELLDNN